MRFRRVVCRPSPSLPSRVFCSQTKAPYLAQLLRWLEDHGGYGQFCVVSSDLSYEKGRGMFAVEHLKEQGPAVIRVPKSLAISIPNLEKRTVSPSLSWKQVISHFEGVTSNPSFNAAAVLAMFLLREQAMRKTSFYYHWIRHFPDELHTALYLGKREMEELEGCVEAIDLISTQAEAFLALDKAKHALCLQHAEEFQPHMFPTDQFKWAFSTVLARSITDEVLPALVPYVDFMNVSSIVEETNADIFLSDSVDEYEVRVNRAVLQGQEVTVSYCSSEAGGAEMFCRYGFIPSGVANDNSYVRFRMRVPKSVMSKFSKHMKVWDPHTQLGGAYDRGDGEEQEMTEEMVLNEMDSEDELPYLDVEDDRVEIPIDFGPAPAPSPAWIIEILRALVIARHDLKKYSPFDPLPLEYEIGVYEKLLDILETRLEQYLTTITEDMALLRVEDAQPAEVPHLRSFGSQEEDALKDLEEQAARANHFVPAHNRQDHKMPPQVEEVEREALRVTKSKEEGIEHRTFIHIVRLRMQEKMILQYHVAEIEKTLEELEDQYERRLRILKRAPNSKPS